MVEHNQAEEALHSSDRSYRAIFDAANDAIFVHDAETGAIVDANQKATEMFGYTTEEFRQLNVEAISDGIPPYSQQEALHWLQQANAGSPQLFTWKAKDKAGRIFWIEVNLKRATISGVPRLLAIVRDITERKQGEEALRKSEAKYRRLHESMMDAFVSVDMDGWIHEYNEAYCKMLGYEPEELLELRYTDITPEKWHPFEAEIVRKQILPQGYSDTYEKEYRRKDGMIFPVELRTFLITDEKGQPSAMWAIVRDITERKRAEEALKKAHDELERKVEERTADLRKANDELTIFRRFVEAAGQGFGIADVNGCIKYLNPAMCRIMGERCIDDVVGQSILGYGRSVEFMRDTFLPTVLREGRWENEGTMHTRSGKVLPIWNSSTIIRDDQGQPAYIAAVLTDITERKQAEDALRASEEKHRGLVEACPDAVVMTDLGGRILFASPQTWRLLGLPESDELVGRSVFDCVVEVDRQRLAANLSDVINKGLRRDTEYTALRKDGSTVACEASSVVIRDANGKPKAAMAVIRDITERKQAEEAMRASEERFRSYFEQGLIGMAVASLDRRWLEVNDRLCEILGYSREELLKMTWTEVTHPEDVEPNLVFTRRALVGEIDHFTMDKRFLRKDGSTVYTTIFVRYFRDKRGRIDHVFVLTEDITQRKQAEESLRQSQAILDAFFNASMACLNIFDDQFRYIKTDNVTPTYFGHDSQSIVGKSVEDLAPAWFKEYRPMLQRVVETGKSVNNIETKGSVPNRPGEVCYWQASIFAIPLLERKQGVGVVAVEITDIKRAEEALRQSYEELRAIYGSLGDGLIVADVKSLRIKRVNAASCSMLGYAEEELLSLSISALHPKDALSSIIEPLHPGIVGRLPAKNDVPMLRKDGSIFYADLTGDTFVYKGIPCCLGVFRDATERRQAQEALQREHRTLKHMLQSSDHERQLIAYEIHDGLAQHLAAAIMQFDTFSHLKDKQPKDAERAFEAGVTMLRQGHFEARRLISGVRPPVLDESGVVEAIAHLVHEESRRKVPKIEFHSLVDFDRLVPILENAIYRIVQESLTNACNYSKSKKVRISLLQRKNTVRIEVRDWGVGFNPKAVPKGHFGLAGIRERARLLGGKCRMRSMSGEGTSIVVELPVVEREVEE